MYHCQITYSTRYKTKYVISARYSKCILWIQNKTFVFSMTDMLTIVTVNYKTTHFAGTKKCFIISIVWFTRYINERICFYFLVNLFCFFVFPIFLQVATLVEPTMVAALTCAWYLVVVRALGVLVQSTSCWWQINKTAWPTAHLPSSVVDQLMTAVFHFSGNVMETGTVWMDLMNLKIVVSNAISGSLHLFCVLLGILV